MSQWKYDEHYIIMAAYIAAALSELDVGTLSSIEEIDAQVLDAMGEIEAGNPMMRYFN